MSPSGNLDWVWYGAGVVLALLGLALTYWSLLHDRARGRRRCPKCWYDMSSPGPDPLTCPECGRTAKREKKLFKTRRRWGWATVVVFFLLGAISLSLTPQVKREGWLSIVPRRGLILAIELSDDYPDQVYTHIIFHRRDDQKLWDMILDLCIEGDPWARPVSEAWKQKYGAILDSFRGSSTKKFDPALEERWLTLPSQIHFEIRSPWPIEIPIVIEPQIGLWWRDNMDMTLSVTPQWGELGIMEVGYAQDFLFLPVMAEGEHRLAFDIERKRRRRIYLGSAESDYPYFRHEFDDLGPTTLARSIRIEGNLSDYLKEIKDAQMIAALRDGLKPKIRMFKGVWIDGELFPDNIFFILGYDATFSFIQLFQGAAIGLKIELLHDDQLVGTCHLVWPGGPSAKYVAYHGRNLKIYGISKRQVEGLIETHDITEGNWTFRVTEDASMALTVPGATSYWTGSFTVPVEFVKEYE